jgi:hypothetical protein
MPVQDFRLSTVQYLRYADGPQRLFHDSEPRIRVINRKDLTIRLEDSKQLELPINSPLLQQLRGPPRSGLEAEDYATEGAVSDEK